MKIIPFPSDEINTTSPPHPTPRRNREKLIVFSEKLTPALHGPVPSREGWVNILESR